MMLQLHSHQLQTQQICRPCMMISTVRVRSAFAVDLTTAGDGMINNDCNAYMDPFSSDHTVIPSNVQHNHRAITNQESIECDAKQRNKVCIMIPVRIHTMHRCYRELMYCRQYGYISDQWSMAEQRCAAQCCICSVLCNVLSVLHCTALYCAVMLWNIDGKCCRCWFHGCQSCSC